MPSPFATLEQLSGALAAGQATSAGLVEMFLERAGRLDPRLHAFVEVFAETARAQAAAADQARAAGRAAGPLHGLPIVLKDLIDVPGRVTRAGSRAWPARPAEQAAGVLERLQAAGMIVLGKTHTVEFAFGGWGTNPVMGTPWNPWDMGTQRAPGGSSSGTGVAVAAGLAPAGLGTDTGGSVRTPSCLCGLVGLKTSRGLVGRGGVFPLALSLDTIGPMARSVRDAALLLAAMAGPDARDEATQGAPAVDPMAAIEDGIAGLRLGRLAEAELAGLAPAMRALYDDALQTFQQAGAVIEPAAFPRPIADYMAACGDIMSFESYARLGAYVDAPDSVVAPAVRQRIARGVTRAAYDAILQRRVADQAAFLHAIAGLHAVIAPVCQDAAPEVAAVDEATQATPYGRFVNFLDLASLALPAGLIRGLPAGIQVIVRRFDDATALRIGRAFEQARGGSLVQAPPGLDTEAP